MDTGDFLLSDKPPEHDGTLDELREHRGRRGSLKPKPRIAQRKDEDGREDHVQNSASTHDEHSFHHVTLAAHYHVGALGEVHEQAATEDDAQICRGQVEH